MSALPREHGQARSSLLRLLDQVVDDRVEEDTANADAATDKLQGVQALAHDNGDADDDDDALGGVGDGLRHGVGLLDGHGGQLVVAIEPQAGVDQVHEHDVARLAKRHEFAELVALGDEHEHQAEQERIDRRERELVANTAHAVLQTIRAHQLFVLVALEGGEDVCQARREERRPSEVQLAEGGEADAADDGDEAEPLGEAHLGFVECRADQGGEGRLGRLHDLAEGHGTSREREDGGGVRTRRCEAHEQGLLPIIERDLGQGARIGVAPEEQSPDATNAQLQRGDGHRETGSTTGSLQGKLVRDVVVVVAEIPEEEIQHQGDVDLAAATRSRRDGGLGLQLDAVGECIGCRHEARTRQRRGLPLHAGARRREGEGGAEVRPEGEGRERQERRREEQVRGPSRHLSQANLNSVRSVVGASLEHLTPNARTKMA
mmetsp:Transcript_14016/g.38566  ORF Transcript_14016/g.38566 Transcript_14016/m.38566 type:complete len:433 (-) Transcript_14016:3-1301(-)